MPNSPVTSRPQYPGLRPVPSARRHVVAAEGAGARAVLALVSAAAEGFLARTHLIYADVMPASDDADRLRACGADCCEILPDVESVLGRLRVVLGSATMGTRLYLAGTEGFIGRALCVAVDLGMDHRSVLAEHSGSRARRVQCVHCKAYAENVAVATYECAGCGSLLSVRDHYSRRLAAFQGVAADAEDPGEPPPAEEPYR